ncbi:hypothetical protein IAT38_005389 [Cryptococcus sp. DSM 104549]
MPIPFYTPVPAPPAAFAAFAGQPLPLSSATFFSKFVSNWVGPMMKVAWSREVVEDDLWDVTPDLACRTVGDRLEGNYVKRLPPSRRPPAYRQISTAEKPPPSPDLDNDVSDLAAANTKRFGKSRAAKIEAGEMAVEDGKLYDMSLGKAIYSTVWTTYWESVGWKLIGQTLRVTAPLVTKVLITQLTRSYAYHTAVTTDAPTDGLTPPRSAGYMFGVAIGLWAMLVTSSSVFYYGWFVSSVTAKLTRSALITMISRKTMRLSGRSRVEFTNGKVTTMLSVDTSFIDRGMVDGSEFPLFFVTLPLGIGLLIYTIGYSALVGLGVLLLTGPFKYWMFKRITRLRKTQTSIVDTRVRILSEILNNIRAVKLYAYESWWAEKIGGMRREELGQARKNNLGKSGMNMTMTFVPTLAAILTFITYALSGHQLDAAIIFTSLQYFNVLKLPITFLPQVMSAIAEGMVGLKRVSALMRAEELRSEITIDPASEFAIDVNANFQFESVESPETLEKRQQEEKEKEKRINKEDKGSKKEDGPGSIPAEPVGEKDEVKQPFALRDITLRIPRGALVCVVGRVGTGKTALLSGLINEMKRTNGNVVFGGSVSYVPQQAWVQSGSIRDNITFTHDPPTSQAHFNSIIHASALGPDVASLPHGALTQIGERGITLSGGQRQRICIARAAYAKSEVLLLDDPLSAVDAHVGKWTRVLVTHQLDVLPQADLIVVMGRDDDGNGRIEQQGSFDDLMDQEGTFRSLIEQYGSTSASPSGIATPAGGLTSPPLPLAFPFVESSTTVNSDKEKSSDSPADGAKDSNAEPEAPKLILDEEKAQGAVGLAVYINHFRAVGSASLPITVGSLLVLSQGATVFNTLFLGYWSENKFPELSMGGYIGIYGGLGAAMALLSWGAIYTTYMSGIKASFTMFNEAWDGVVRSSLSWHDRTPTGRIVNRMSKDIENLDDRLPQVWYNVLSGSLSILASLALVLYIYPWIGLMFIPVLAFDYFATTYYRRTTRDIQRLLSITRSYVYSNFSEQLSGLPVIRAFHQQDNSERTLEAAVDKELVALLAGRISFTSYLLVLSVALFGVIFRNSVSSAKFGVVLIYVIASTSIEQQMNTVERVQYYATLPRERAPVLPSDPPTNLWPTRGALSFQAASLRYRPDLPLVLKRVSFDVQGGEKVGVIGRTGAGKSSLVQAIFRTVELEEDGGRVEVDGQDLGKLGLDTLRSRLSIIPQEAFLFGGSVRDNIDPTHTRSDSDLASALALINTDPSASAALREKFKLEGVVADGGVNFSAGERQLLALVRALVRGCKLLVLDEATSSVDPETDALIQRIIQTKFSDVTLLSIAHRLQTVAYYDRILVMEAGEVAEYDTPLALFDRPGGSIFRGLCEAKGLTREDLLRIREEAAKAA